MSADALESQHALTLRPGASLADRFRVVRSVRGTSAFTVSYVADDQCNGDVVVIKEFFPRSLVSRGADGATVRPHSPEVGRDFLRALHRFALEGAVLAEVSHPNVLRVRAVVHANETVYWVMDQHQTQTLAAHVQSVGGRLSTSDAGRIVQQLSSALEQLHAESIIHRDLSPRTVHIRNDGSALLLEFSARRHLPIHAADLAPGFAAFEQYGTRDVGPWTDVYAASAVLYYLLTGVTPPSALERAAGEAVLPPSSVAPGLAPNVARFVLRGMSLLPQQRPHAASELRRQLEAALAEGVASARGAQAQRAVESGPPTDDGIVDEDGGTMQLRLAPGGIVIPGEESASTQLLRKLGSAAARLLAITTARTPSMKESLDLDQLEWRPMAAGAPPAQARAAVATDLELAPPTRPYVAESPLPVDDESTAALSVAQQIPARLEMDAALTRPNHGRRYSLAAAAALVLAIGSSLVLLARNGRASGIRGTPSLALDRPIVTSSAATQPTGEHESVDGGAVLQSATDTATAPVRDGAPPPASKRETTPSRSTSAARSPRPVADQRPEILPFGRLPSLTVAIGSTGTELRIVPPELLVDARTRLTNGGDQTEQGDYVIARRTFRTAMLQLDSVATRYPDSESIRSLRRELEQADGRTVQACTAENEMRKRRGEEVRACQ